MLNERKTRKLTMLHAKGYAYQRRVPCVMLGGVWLKDCGFEPGDKVSVEQAGDGKLVITKVEAAQ